MDYTQGPYTIIFWVLGPSGAGPQELSYCLQVEALPSVSLLGHYLSEQPTECRKRWEYEGVPKDIRFKLLPNPKRESGLSG